MSTFDYIIFTDHCGNELCIQQQLGTWGLVCCWFFLLVPVSLDIFISTHRLQVINTSSSETTYYRENSVRVNRHLLPYHAKYDSTQMHSTTKVNKKWHKREDCIDAGERTGVSESNSVCNTTFESTHFTHGRRIDC